MVSLITTSWDDGSTWDFKLAALLQKHNLPATFYIPRGNRERSVITPQEIQTLAQQFEIGGHGLNHLRLASHNENFLRTEIKGSHDWLSDVLGTPPSSFCFPGGAYNSLAVKTVFASGYRLARTTELFSTKLPSPAAVTATTLQVYPHSAFTYAKHLTKRRKWLPLFYWMKTKTQTDLRKLTEHYLHKIGAEGGCFHLWGHSWEIEEANLWGKVEELFKTIANRPGFVYSQNCDALK